MATNTTNLQLVKPAPDDFYDIAVHNGNMDKIDAAIQQIKTGSTGSVSSTGGTMTGTLNIQKDGEGLSLKGTRTSFAGLYPEGEAAGRKGYWGFGKGGSHDFIIANEYPDGNVVFNQKGQEITLDSLNAKPTTEQVTQAVNAAKTEAANTYMPKATTQATGDWNNYTTTGFYDGQGLANSPGTINPDIGVDWYYVEVIAHSLDAGQWVTQIAHDFNNSNIYRRTKHGGVWSTWEPINFGQLIRNNNGTLEYLDQGVWKPVSGGGQVARASDNVKYTYTEPEYSYTVQTSNFGYLKVYTIEPNIKGTFKIMADVAWGYATPQTGTYTIGLVAFSLEKNDRSNYRAGSDYPEGLAQLLTPAGTGSDSVVGLNSMGSDLSASNVTILSAQDEFKTISINIATTGEFPVCIYAIFRPQSGSGNGVILKAKNIKVCYDLV